MRRLFAIAVATVLTAVFLSAETRPASGTQIDLSTHGVGPLDAASYADGGVRSTTDEPSGVSLAGASSFRPDVLWPGNTLGRSGRGAIDAATASAPIPLISGIAVGQNHSCALTRSGGVKCWGDNSSGQLGNGTTFNSRTPVDVAGLASGVAAIAAGQANTCALTRSGGVKCWGGNGWGQLGNGTRIASSAPVDVVGLGTGVTAIAVGWLHACVLTSSGGVKCWGALLRDGSHTARTAPVDVFGATSGIRAITAGYLYTCALTTGGGMKCWGENRDGQLGDGTTTARYIPVDVQGLTSGVAAIAAGLQHACALTNGGGVLCWGLNLSGQLGNPNVPPTSADVISRSLVPVGVVGLTTGAIEIAAGYAHTCAITSDGGVGCWGYNHSGQLGDGTRLPSGVPVVVSGLLSGVVGIAAASGEHTCALMRAGGVKCWGNNEFGQLGNGKTTLSTVPVDVDFTIRPSIVLRSTKPPGTIARGTALTFSATVRPVGAASDRATVRFEIYRQDSGVWRLADRRDVPADATGVATLRWTFVTVGPRYVRARTLANQSDLASAWSQSLVYTVASFPSVPPITAIAAGYDHACALTTAGGVKCWGWNGNGQLGDGTQISSSVPLDVSGLPGQIRAISAGGGHTCALASDGGVRCWGSNGSGELGNGTTIDSSFPVGVSGLTSGVSAIALGSPHSCALTSRGGVKCWGNNEFGQLGDGTTSRSPIPVDVLGLASGVRAISAGGGHTCALTSAGGVRCWGSNYAGQLGNGTTTNSSAPVEVAGLPGGVVAITTGIYHSCALSSSGGVTCWGALAVQQTDDGGLSSNFALVPLQVPGLASGVASISANGFHTCALTAGSAAMCWGDNRSGQLGDGTTSLSSTPVAVQGLASGVAAIGAGVRQTCALTRGAGIWCWGANEAGQLGDGSTVDSSTPVQVLGLSVRKPDGRIRLGTGAFVGNNVYNTTGANQQATVETIATREGTHDTVYTVDISIQNDGTSADSFMVKATGTARSAYSVKFLRGTTDITAAVVAGTYETSSLAPAATYLIRARVTVRPGGLGADRLVSIRSFADATKIDAVKFVLKVTACGC